jgi:hypothetical protein
MAVEASIAGGVVGAMAAGAMAAGAITAGGAMCGGASVGVATEGSDVIEGVRCRDPMWTVQAPNAASDASPRTITNAHARRRSGA